jgi:hypothetical protein
MACPMTMGGMSLGTFTPLIWIWLLRKNAKFKLLKARQDILLFPLSLMLMLAIIQTFLGIVFETLDKF